MYKLLLAPDSCSFSVKVTELELQLRKSLEVAVL